MWMKVHTLRQFIDSESDKTERRVFYFHSKTKCTYHFNICFSSPYFGGIQHFILHKKTFRKKCHFDWYRVKCTRGCDTSQMIFMKNIFWKKNHLIWNKVAIFWLIRLTVVVVYRNVYSPNKFSRRHYRLDNFFRFSILIRLFRTKKSRSQLEIGKIAIEIPWPRFGSIRVGWSRLGSVRVSLGRLGSVRVSSVRLGGFSRVRISSDWYMVPAPNLRTRLRTLICWRVLHTGKPHEFCK